MPNPASITLSNAEIAGLRRWSLNGYAPGGYHCRCTICEMMFEGDKRATHCLTCAAKLAALATPSVSAVPAERVLALAKEWRDTAMRVRGEWAYGLDECAAAIEALAKGK